MTIGVQTSPVFTTDKLGEKNVLGLFSLVSDNFTDVDENNPAFVEYKKFVKVDKTDREDVRVKLSTGVGNLVATAQGADYETSTRVRIPHTTYKMKKYSLKEEITEEAIKYSRESELKDIGTNLGEAKARFNSNFIVSVLNNGFSGTVNPDYEYQKMGNDESAGEKLFSVIHKLPSGDTFSNVLATSPVMNYESLKSAFTMLKTMPQYSESGSSMRVAGSKYAVICGADNEMTARTLSLSDLAPGTTNNDINVIKGTFDVIVLDGITPGSWYVVNMTLSLKAGFDIYENESPQDTGVIFDRLTTKNGNYEAVVKKFMGGGYRDVRHIVASKGDLSTVIA